MTKYGMATQNEPSDLESTPAATDFPSAVHYALYLRPREGWLPIRCLILSRIWWSQVSSLEFETLHCDVLVNILHDDRDWRKYPSLSALRGVLCHRVFHSLARLWKQLDLFEVYEWECQEIAVVFVELLSRGAYSNSYRASTHQSMMSAEEFWVPSLRGVFSVVHHEKSRSFELTSSVDASALAAQHCMTSPSDDFGSGLRNFPHPSITGQVKQGRPWCPKCHKPTHTLETCWKIHGKPADWKPACERRANSVLTDTTSLGQLPSRRNCLRSFRNCLDSRLSHLFYPLLARVMWHIQVLSHLPIHSMICHPLG